MNANETIYVAGHRGMVGSAILRALHARGYKNLITATHAELDLTRQVPTEEFILHHRPEVIILAAARVGGILANSSYPADYIYDNLAIAMNVIEGAHRANTQRLLFLGSSCIYPKFAPQPIAESSLLTGSLEPTNEAYALAKIAGVKLCEHYRKQHGRLFHSVMPCNLYGPGDNYNPENSHVIPGLIRRFYEAKTRGDTDVVIWGSGRPLREFLHADDLAAGCLHLLALDSPPDLINLGSGSEITIADLARTIADIYDYQGTIRLDPSKPDGTPRKVMDSSLLRSLGWEPKIPIEAGLRQVCAEFAKNAG